VLATPLQGFSVRTVHRNVNIESIYFVTFAPEIAIKAFGATTTGGTGTAGTGRIYIDFPTPVFASDLGTGKTTGEMIPCKSGFASAN